MKMPKTERDKIFFFVCRTFDGFYNCVLARGEVCESEGVASDQASSYITKIKTEQLDLPLYCEGVQY